MYHQRLLPINPEGSLQGVLGIKIMSKRRMK
jgi:hypothetical protein